MLTPNLTRVLTTAALLCATPVAAGAASDPLAPNLTFLPQLFFFAVGVYIINELILKPYAASMEMRENAVSGAGSDTEAAVSAAREAREQYDGRIAAARSDAEEKRNSAREEARGEERSILDAALAEARTKTDAAEQDLRNQVESARSALEGEAQTLAKSLAEAALGRAL